MVVIHDLNGRGGRDLGGCDLGGHSNCTFGLQGCQNFPGTLQHDQIESWYMTLEAKKQYMVYVCSMGINHMDAKLGETVHLEVRIVLKWF